MANRRIAELEDERDIFKRTLDKRDTELASANRTIALICERMRPLLPILLADAYAEGGEDE